jgi:ubiquinone/menaquinone biosynthesis C-methylase UbiE
MTHGKKYHNEDERRKWQDPEKILADIGLKPGNTFIDVACGKGFFTIPAAKAISINGNVIGIDANEEAIEELTKKIEKEGLKNISLYTGLAEDIIACDKCADFIFYGICLHDFEDPVKVLKNARKMIKNDGYLIDLDWKKEQMEMGPPIDIRFSEVKASELIMSAGFKVEKIKESGPYHYIIIARPA